MADESQFSPANFGAAFKGFMDQMIAQAPATEPPFARILREHFGVDPTTLPTLSEVFRVADHPNLQLALDAYLAEAASDVRLLGMRIEFAYHGVTFAHLIGGSAIEAPVEYVNLPAADDGVITCTQHALLLFRQGDEPVAMIVRGPDETGFRQRLHCEVMVRDKSLAVNLFARLRALMRSKNIYRGRVISLSVDESHSVLVRFHRLPQIARGAIILPEGVLERIERQTIHFSDRREKLLAAGRHLKRGLLLHGAPGTGKTLTAMYLAGRMKERTTILLTGRGLGMLEESCRMARALQPATVILEDVDLVAEERTRPNACNSLLFELLNQMDGLADDADILFVLTTNRPDILEPALASRPGRIDQAIEVPLPDAACRDRLIALYSEGLSLDLRDRAQVIKRTEGVSAAFIREMLRKAALFAADDGEQLVVRDRHMDEALHELVVAGGPLTQSLLGGKTIGPSSC